MTNRNFAMPAAGFEEMLKRAPDSPILNDLRSAMGKAIAEFKAAQESVSRIGGDKTLNDAQRLVRQATVARAKMEPALASLRKAIATVESNRKAHSAKLNEVLAGSETLAQVSLRREIRDHLRSLSPSDRVAFIAGAIDSFDLTTLEAIGSAPAYLSGAVPDLHSRARQTFLELMAPDNFKAAQALAEGEKFAEMLETHLNDAAAGLVDFASADEIARTATAA